LIIRPHPTEIKKGTVEVYLDTIALNLAHDWFEVDHESDINECLAAADVVFTIFSNVGIEAAVLGKLVGTLQLPGIPAPFDLAEFGISSKLDSEKLIRNFVLDAMVDGFMAKSCRAKQNQFLQKNPQLLHGTLEERVLPILFRT
jgi:capsule polysaccharide export protein KpsC/LpsZ